MGRVSEEVQNLRQISLEHQEADRMRQMHQENRKRTERGEERSRSPLRGGYSGRGGGYRAGGGRGGGRAGGRAGGRGEGVVEGRTGGRGDGCSGHSGRENEARLGDSSQDFSQDDGSASAASIEIEDDILQQEDERKREEEEGVSTRIPIDLLLKITPIALKEGLTVRQVVMMVSAFIIICKSPLDRFILSLSTAHRCRRREAGRISSDALDGCIREVKEKKHKLVLHSDGKTLQQDFQGVRESAHRLVTIVSSPHLVKPQLLAGSHLENETGYEVATECYNQLLGNYIVEETIVLVADSPTVNFGQQEGALQHLCRMCEKDMLKIPCVHHTEVFIH